jgi:hypothetical protein
MGEDEEDDGELRDFLGPLMQDGGEVERESVFGERRTGGRRRRNRPRTRLRRGLQAEAQEDELHEGGSVTRGGTPVELLRQLESQSRGLAVQSWWSQGLHSIKGALMIAALHQYLLWKRYSWGSPAIEDEGATTREFRRLEAAWQFARRGC